MFNFAMRYMISFSALALLVVLIALAGLKPSEWTIAIMLTASFVLAYITKPEVKP